MSHYLAVLVWPRVSQVDCIVFVWELNFKIHLVEVTLPARSIFIRLLVLFSSTDILVKIILINIVVFLVINIRRYAPSSALNRRLNILNL